MSSHLCFSLLLNIQRQIELQNEKRGLRDSPVNCQAELPNFPTRQKVKGSSTKRLQELSKASTHSLRLDLDGVWKRSKKQPSGINPELHGPMSYVSPASLRQKQNHESPRLVRSLSTENKNRRDLVSLRGTSIHDSGVMWMFFPWDSGGELLNVPNVIVCQASWSKVLGQCPVWFQSACCMSMLLHHQDVLQVQLTNLRKTENIKTIKGQYFSILQGQRAVCSHGLWQEEVLFMHRLHRLLWWSSGRCDLARSVLTLN